MTLVLPDPEALCAELVRQLSPHVTADTALVGIHTGGVWLAERLHAALGIALPLGLLDISFYRDDFDKTGLHPQIKPTKIPFDVGFLQNLPLVMHLAAPTKPHQQLGYPPFVEVDL